MLNNYEKVVVCWDKKTALKYGQGNESIGPVPPGDAGKKNLFLFELLKKQNMFHFLFLCDVHFRRIT